eukprot:UN01824
MDDIGKEVGFDVNAQRAPYSLSVTFIPPSPEISEKYSIPQETERGVQRSHIYCMKHVTEKEDKRIDRFLKEYKDFALHEAHKKSDALTQKVCRAEF